MSYDCIAVLLSFGTIFISGGVPLNHVREAPFASQGQGLSTDHVSSSALPDCNLTGAVVGGAEESCLEDWQVSETDIAVGARK